MTWNENDLYTIFTVQSLPSKLFFRLYMKPVKAIRIIIL